MSGTGQTATSLHQQLLASAAATTPAPTIAQPMRVGADGEVKPLGGPVSVGVVEGVQPLHGHAEQTANQEIDPATGKPKVEPAPEIDPATGKPKEAPAEDKPAKVPPTAEELAAAKTEAAKVDPRFVPYTEEFMTTGDLTPESVTKAASDFGVTENIVKDWIAGQKAIAAQTQASNPVNQQQAAFRQGRDNEVLQILGGDTGFKEFKAWADANLSAEDQQDWNDALKEPNPRIAQRVFNDIHGRYKAAGNGGGRLDLSQGGGAQQNERSGVQGFESLTEQTKAISDPRYRNDPAYRAGVEARIKVSSFR